MSTLASLRNGSCGRILTLPSGMPTMTRLRELGLLPGTLVKLIRRAPLGDPLEISVRGSLLSLRKSEAELIAVEPV
jgi:ferrous iron transport protein A